MTTPGPSSFAPGLQPERTLLAWRRTALAVALSSAVGARIAVAVLGWPAVVVGGLGVGAGLLTYAATVVRYRRVVDRLARTGRYPGTGWPPPALTAAVLLVGLLALLYVVGA